MHGIIFFELKNYAESLGPGVWWSLIREARLEGRLYVPLRIYPDSDLRALVEAAARLQSQQEQQVLESFGHFLAPRLLSFYQVFADPSWRTLDVLERAETCFYASIHRMTPEVSSAPFRARRVRPDELEILYVSHRKLCSMARGMIRGLADHFGETVVVREVECMLSGGECCRLIVTRSSSSRSGPEPRDP